MKKTFRIGESCYGGILKISTFKNQVTISCHEWSTGKLLDGYWATSENRAELYELLHDYTSCYHACNAMEWIDKNAKLTTESRF